MIFFSTRTRRRFWSLGGPWIVAFGLAGCDRDDVKVYRVTKEQTPAQQPSAAPMPSGHPEVNSAKPQLAWTLPSGWVQTGPGKMSVASFTIAGKDGKEAQVTVTPLQGLAGKEALIVNMWRQQAGLPELSAEEAERQLSPVEVGGDPGKMFEVNGKGDGTNPPVRIVTAMAHRTDGSWFYKLAGEADLVETQKPAFVAFLKSIKISGAAAVETTTAPAPVPTPASSAPVSTASSQWKTPADWKNVPPGPMQDAKFSVPNQGAAKGDVTISVFPNSTGGTLANVNRWRGQLSLPDAEEADLARLVTPLDGKIPGAMLVDLNGKSSKTGQPARLIGAIVPRDGQWFFYKLLGDPDAVAPQRDAFIAFAKAAR